MQLRYLLNAFICIYFQCEHEYPSDPLASDRLFFRDTNNGTRNSRFFETNEVNGDRNPIVATNAGAVQGYTMKTIKGRSFFAFEGIPFGEDTGGVNRFKPPKPKSKWTGIRPAMNVGSKCLQLHLLHAMRVVGSEDCLFLNVYTPQIPNKNLANLPVLVFIHGGSWYFSAGSEYGPAYLLEHDIILVTINYRLGIFGFFSAGDDVIPGNYGLKDQALALQWVHENIKAFSGNPNEVTIAGQSAGAASVHLHMMSNLSRGTFTRAISVSGNAFSPWAINNKRFVERNKIKLARASRCPSKNSENFLRCLQKMSGRRLVRLLWRIFDIPVIPIVPLGAVIEPHMPEAFLTMHPDEAYAQGKVDQISFICSRNTNESDFIFRGLKLMGLAPALTPDSPMWKTLGPILLDYKLVANNPNEITKKVEDFYVKQNNFPTKGHIYSEFSEDRIFGYPIHKSLQLHSQIAPTYSWFYGYQGRSSLLGLAGGNPKDFGVSHIDDLPMYFNMSEYFSGYKTTEPEYAIVKLMTSLIANFVTSGKPLYTDESGVSTHIWDPITDPRNISVLSINEEVRMIPEPFQGRYKFWESLGLQDMKPAKLKTNFG